MKTLRLLFASLFVVAFLSGTNAQDYKSAIGVKLGYGLVASYKTFLNEKSAVDIFGGIRWGGIAAGAYYEIHKPIKSVDRLKWYWGGGASFTTWDYGYAGFDSYYELGVSGVLGLDYTFDDYPVNVSVDWAPTIVLVDSWDYPYGSLSRFRSGYGAFSVRYILGK
ncbi:MAG: hypothetical protein IPN73_03970 [Saprospiraceae bacterium]|jgi:hypothetical protein|nr:hypothetical protein [Saprospiraceae bacterium]